MSFYVFLVRRSRLWSAVFQTIVTHFLGGAGGGESVWLGAERVGRKENKITGHGRKNQSAGRVAGAVEMLFDFNVIDLQLCRW